MYKKYYLYVALFAKNHNPISPLCFRDNPLSLDSNNPSTSSNDPVTEVVMTVLQLGLQTSIGTGWCREKGKCNCKKSQNMRHMKGNADLQD